MTDQVAYKEYHPVKRVPNDFIYVKAEGETYKILKQAFSKYSKVFAVALETVYREPIKLDSPFCDAEVLRMVAKGLKYQVYKEYQEEGYNVDEKELDGNWNLMNLRHWSDTEDEFISHNIFKEEDDINMVKTWVFGDAYGMPSLQCDCIHALVTTFNYIASWDPRVEQFIDIDTIRTAYDLTAAGSPLRKCLVDGFWAAFDEETEGLKEMMAKLPREYLVDVAFAKTKRPGDLTHETILLSDSDYISQE